MNSEYYSEQPEDEFVIGDTDNKHVVASVLDATHLLVDNFAGSNVSDPFDIIAEREEALGRPLALDTFDILKKLRCPLALH